MVLGGVVVAILALARHLRAAQRLRVRSFSSLASCLARSFILFFGTLLSPLLFMLLLLILLVLLHPNHGDQGQLALLVVRQAEE